MMALGLSPALGLPPAAAPPAGPNPNLLLWSEALDNAVWVKTNCAVTANQDLGTADELFSTGAAAILSQTTAVTATVGAPVTADVGPHGGYVADSVTGIFDGLPYTLTVKNKDAGGGESITVKLAALGGFLVVSILEPVGDGDCLIQFCQLEQAGAFSSYHLREGT